MNSYYHPRDHEHKDQAHCHETHRLPATPIAYTGHEFHARHDGSPAQGAGDEQGGEGTPYSEKDLDLYRVLVAVERGELSVQDAARKLEELDDQAPGEESTELI